MLAGVLATLTAILGAIQPPKVPPPVPEPATVPSPAPEVAPESSTPTPEVIAPRKSSYPPAVERWRPLIQRVGLPEEWALRVIRCESGGRPDADENPPYVGLFQIDRGPYDPESNATIAAEMYRRRGRQPWPTCGRR